ncbi:MAG: hypothetical protein WCK96_08610 [Methylococcales bacterium]
MNAVEFQATVHNGVITLPTNQQAWNGKKIRVILLDETSPYTTELSAQKSITEDDFFNAAGLWKDRGISQESIRAEAWRDNEQ